MCNEDLLRLFYATHSSEEMATDVYETIGHHSMSPRVRESSELSHAPSLPNNSCGGNRPTFFFKRISLQEVLYGERP